MYILGLEPQLGCSARLRNSRAKHERKHENQSCDDGHELHLERDIWIALRTLRLEVVVYDAYPSLFFLYL